MCEAVRCPTFPHAFMTCMRTAVYIHIYIYIYAAVLIHVMKACGNSVVEDEPYRNIDGPHGLGRKNHRGEMLINFCERNGLIVTNTWFRKPKRRLYTWEAPEDRS